MIKNTTIIFRYLKARLGRNFTKYLIYLLVYILLISICDYASIAFPLLLIKALENRTLLLSGITLPNLYLSSLFIIIVLLALFLVKQTRDKSFSSLMSLYDYFDNIHKERRDGYENIKLKKLSICRAGGSHL